MKKRLLAMLMATAMLFTALPKFVFAQEDSGNTGASENQYIITDEMLKQVKTPEEKPTREITEAELSQTKSLNGTTPSDMTYDTFYYTDDYTYTVGGQAVTFTDTANIQVDVEDNTRAFQNKKVSYSVDVDSESDQIVITFDEALNIPIGQATDKYGKQWDSTSRNYNIEYQTNIPEIAIVTSENKNLTSLTIKGIPANGTYNLTGGKIFERGQDEDFVNPQFPFGCTVIGGPKEGKFSVLPDISFTVDGSEKLGFVELSLESRTIGKGDVLSAKDIAIPKADTTVKDILDIVAKEHEIKYTEVGDQFLISSIAGDGSTGAGGWRYQVNGDSSNTAINQHKIKSGDVIRIRYAVTAGAEELNKPLWEYLKTVVGDSQSKLASGNYTLITKQTLEKAIAEAQVIINDESYNSTDTDKELAVSEKILAVNTAVKNLVINQDGSSEDSQVPLDFENDLWLKYDFKQLKTGDTATIYPRRVPQIVSDSINNDVARPNFNFAIVSGDSVKITPVKDINRNDSAKIEAVKNGITVVKVTYDNLLYEGMTFGASSPINTAYVVYEVNDDPANLEITTNITQRSYDTIYFDKGESIDFPFTAEAAGASIKVTCNGEVLTKKDGKYVAKLKNKSNIIGIIATDSSDKTKTFHQVIDARKIEINIVNKTTPGEKLKINDTAIVSFTGIANPIYKLATIYNPTWRSISDVWESTYGNYVEYHNDHFGKLEGLCSQWDLATNNDFEVTFDKEGTFVFDGGQINAEWWGQELGSDKSDEIFDPGIGGSVVRSGKFSSMPDFTITIGDEVSDNVPVNGIALNSTELELTEGASFQLKATVTPENATNNTVLWNSDGRFFATVDATGKVTAHKASTSNVPETVITARTEDGDFVASCKVVVRAAPSQGTNWAVQNLINDIENLFPVSLRSQNAIALAKSAYNRMTAEQKSKITNISLLFEAESRYLRLKLEQDRDWEQEVNLHDKEAADEVSKMISSLNNITADSKAEIENAIKSYNSLTSAQKKLVKNIAVLVQAENNLLILKLEAEKAADTTVNEENKLQKQPEARAMPTVELPSPASVKSLEIPKSVSKKTIDVAIKINDKLPLLTKNSAEISVLEKKALLELASEYTQLPEEQRLLMGNSADIEGFIENVRTENHQDSKTGIKVDGADWFVGLSIESTTSDPKGFKQVKEMEEAVGNNKLLSAWDISLRNILEDKEYHPNEPVKISIPVASSFEDENVCVLHYKDDGTIEYIDTAISNSAVSFETSEFSYFALMSYADGASPFDLNSTLSKNTKPITSEKSDINTLLLFGIVMVILNGMITFAIMFGFKRKESKKKEHGIEK